ncbi:hypothetical protein HQ520_04895, partial [bacterium]|nr:hypothetical protein [bacterium]
MVSVHRVLSLFVALACVGCGEMAGPHRVSSAPEGNMVACLLGPERNGGDGGTAKWEILCQSWREGGPEGLRILESLLRDGGSRAVERQARVALAEHPTARLRRLREERAYNRVVRWGDLAWKWAGSVVTVNPQGLVDAFRMTALLTPGPGLSVREREILALCNLHANEPWVTAGGGIAGEEVEALRERWRAEKIREAADRGEWEMRRGRWQSAREWFGLAQKGNAASEDLGRRRLEAAVLSERERRARSKGLEVMGNSGGTEREERLAVDLCLAGPEVRDSLLLKTAAGFSASGTDRALGAAEARLHRQE